MRIDADAKWNTVEHRRNSLPVASCAAGAAEMLHFSGLVRTVPVLGDRDLIEACLRTERTPDSESTCT
jgi:hypothetical protein